IVGPSNNPLPVELLSFTGAAFSGYNELYWTTASEINNSGFHIERSVNGRDFRDIGFTEGAGNTNETKNYSFADHSISADLYYYRLRQVDFDGKENFSGIIAVTKSSNKPFTAVAVSPNPFTNTLNIDFSRPLSGELSVCMFSMSGKEII